MRKPRDRRPLGSDASPDLKRVIEALREDGPSGDEMQRMAHKLDAWLETPAAAPGRGQGLLSRRLGKIGLGVLASGALLALLPYLLRNASTHEQPPETAAQHARAPASHRDTAPVLRGGALLARELPGPAPAPQPAPVLQLAAQPGPAAKPELTHGTGSVVPRRRFAAAPSDAPRKHATGARAASPATAERVGLEPASPAVPRDRAASTGTSSAAEPEDSTTPAAPAAASSPAASATARETPSTSQAASSPEAAVAPTRPARDPRAQDTEPAAVSRALPLDEASLLQRARQLARERPAEALRLLDEHERRFASGMLAPEREVLAIEILRAQQRNAEARARLSTFRAQYPDSVYLERLEHP